MPRFTRQEYNLLTADLFDRVPLSVIESPEGQAVIRYFCDKLTADEQVNIWQAMFGPPKQAKLPEA